MSTYGPYTVRKLIGTGATSTVYLAETGDSLAAVKVLHPNLVHDERVRERFVAEATILRTLAHPNILGWRGEDLDAEHPWFATEYCCNGTLADLVLGGRSTEHGVLLLAVEILEALSYLHARGMVHRDVKPENILVDEFGAGRLCDFGITQNALRELTHEGDQMGTPSFMAPEQMDDPRLASPLSDIFSMGSTIYSCLTRSSALPLVVTDLRASALDKLPARLRPIIGRATALDERDRFPTATAFAKELARFL